MMMIFVISTIFLQFIGFSWQDEFDFQCYYDMVEDNLDHIRNYVLPTDNSRIATVIDNTTTYDYGSFDFIVVGAGAAGTVLANRLSEIKKWKVLLLEAGGEQTDFSEIPGYENLLSNSEMNWGYLSAPQESACQGMRNNSCVSPRGLVLGGSTVLNAKMHVRGNREDFNSWSRMGNTGWSYREVLPYFIKSERSHLPDADLGYHGLRGELDVSYFEDSIVTRTFMKGMQELGYKALDYNGRNEIGVSRIQSTISGNKAATGNTAFISPIRGKRKNLNVTINAVVSKVLINKETKTALGVEFIKNGRRYNARASKEVILSAGAINSPQILMLSGIGPKDELERIGVDLILDLPVGENLQDHIMFLGLVIHTNQSIYNYSLAENLDAYLHNHRPLTAGSFLDSTAFINVDDPNSSVPNIQFINSASQGYDYSSPSIFNLRDDAREEFLNNYDSYSDITMLVTLLHPKSIGKITLKSNSIIDFPNIDYRYLSDSKGEDVETIYKGVQQALRLIDTKAYKAVNATVRNVAGYCGELDNSRTYWYCVIRHLMTTIFHPVGTTAMGTSPKNSVVTPKLIVHGMKNLRVADAGIMPIITSGNTQAPVYMIGEKASDEIKWYFLKKKLLSPIDKLTGKL